MAKRGQIDLIEDPEPADPIAQIEARLGKSDWVDVATVATAIDVSVSLIYDLIDEGKLSALNWASVDHKPYWRIYRPSIVTFARSRLSGNETGGK